MYYTLSKMCEIHPNFKKYQCGCAINTPETGGILWKRIKSHIYNESLQQSIKGCKNCPKCCMFICIFLLLDVCAHIDLLRLDDKNSDNMVRAEFISKILNYNYPHDKRIFYNKQIKSKAQALDVSKSSKLYVCRSLLRFWRSKSY